MLPPRSRRKRFHPNKDNDVEIFYTTHFLEVPFLTEGISNQLQINKSSGG
jgi:hypothetical protein